MKFMILVKPHGLYVKTKEFFLHQEGDKEAWGKDWEEIEADHLHDAYEVGHKLRRERCAERNR